VEWDHEARPVRASGTHQDISERKRIELEREEARQATESARQMLQTVLDTIPVRVFWKDLSLNYLGCNQLFAADSGYRRPDELVGLSDFEMGWRNEAERYRADDRRVIEDGKPRIGYEEPQTTPDGRVIWLRTSKIPLKDAHTGETIGVLGSYEDITKRKAAEMALRRYQQIVETASEMLVFVDTDLCYQLVNPAYAAFHHTTPQALQGRRIEEVEDPKIYALIRPQLEASLAGEPRRFTLRGIDPSGQDRWIEAEQRPFHEQDTVTGIVVSLHDLTEVRTAQIALEAERASLEQRVADRTAELQLFKAIVEASEESIAISDPGGALIYINPAHARLFGRSLEAARGVNYRDYYPPESIAVLDREVVPRLKRGEGWEGELDVFGCQGRRFPLWERAGTLHDAQGRIPRLWPFQAVEAS
jgi:PAS domain S-box-containing protein